MLYIVENVNLFYFFFILFILFLEECAHTRISVAAVFTLSKGVSDAVVSDTVNSSSKIPAS